MCRYILILMTLVSIAFFSCSEVKNENSNLQLDSIGGSEVKSFKDETNSILQEALNNHKKQLIDYMNITKNKASSVSDDELMNSFFKTKKEYYYLNQSISIPDDFVKRTKDLCKSIEKHYVSNYMMFYDILFIDTKGEIFYTIKKQKDYHKNIFSSEFENTALSKLMQQKPSESFVDFQFYEISGEPSAFFIEPAKDNNQTIGWFVFQFAIDKINYIFSINDGLGSTGEVLLVNKDHYMLTDSRFKAESTILKQKLAEENITSKFAERKGKKSVIDYRGNKVMTAFEVFEFLDSEWLIIAKMNESEAVTNYYRHYENQLHQKLLDVFSQETKIETEQSIDYQKVINVDMDEFQRIKPHEILYTHGVSTCTAIIVSLPNRFAYMAHISPYDRIYGQNKTDLLGQMLRKIDYLEILQSEKPQIEFTIVSPHKETIDAISKILVTSGYFFHQIKFIHKSEAEEASIFHDLSNNKTIIKWKFGNRNSTIQQDTDYESIGEKLKTKFENY